jgi:hypothetical protein
MKRTKFKNSHILPIIIGVLVAIVIRFNSKAANMSVLEKKWSPMINVDSNRGIKKILHKSIDPSKEIIGVFFSSTARRSLKF